MSAFSRRGPPPIESIIPESAERTDTGYTLRVHMHGLRGIWHRLWAIIATSEALGGGDMADGVAEVRGQFEQQLGRAMTTNEWERLTEDAKAHGQRIAGNT